MPAWWRAAGGEAGPPPHALLPARLPPPRAPAPPTADGQLVPEAPDDTFWALGFNNQIVTVIPTEGIVAVRMGARPPDATPFTEAELTVGVLDAQATP